MSKVAPPSLGESASTGRFRYAARNPAQARYTKGVLYCLAATISFGLMFPIMTSALTRIDPFTFTSLRYLIAAAASVVLLCIKEGPLALRPDGEPVALAWFLGSIGFAGFGFFVFLGQRMAGPEGALTASIMAATQPMLGILIHSVVHRVLPQRYTLLLVLLSFFGVALVVTKGDLGGLLHGSQNYSANALILLGMTFWMIYTFGATRFTRWSPLKYTTLTMCLGLTTITAVNLALLATHVIEFPRAADFIFIIPHVAYMGLIAGTIGVLFWNSGNKILTPLNAVLFMNVPPITAFIVSAITGVVATPVQIVGACVTGGALILNNIYVRRRG